MRQMVLADHDFGVHAHIAGAAENFNHAARGRDAALGKTRQLNVDYGAIEFGQAQAAARLLRPELRAQFGRELLAGRDDDLLLQTRFVGRDGIGGCAVAENSHDGGVRAIHHAHNRTFSTTAAGAIAASGSMRASTRSPCMASPMRPAPMKRSPSMPGMGLDGTTKPYPSRWATRRPSTTLEDWRDQTERGAFASDDCAERTASDVGRCGRANQSDLSSGFCEPRSSASL
jgi:hypothetical protein